MRTLRMIRGHIMSESWLTTWPYLSPPHVPMTSLANLSPQSSGFVLIWCILLHWEIRQFAEPANCRNFQIRDFLSNLDENQTRNFNLMSSSSTQTATELYGQAIRTY